MSLLVICKPLLLFVKSLPADAKDIGGNSDNLSQPIQTELAKKQKYFCNYLAAFLKFTFYFNNLEKQDDPHSLRISRIKDWEKLRVTKLSKKRHLRTPFESHHVKGSQTFVKSA